MNNQQNNLNEISLFPQNLKPLDTGALPKFRTSVVSDYAKEKATPQSFGEYPTDNMKKHMKGNSQFEFNLNEKDKNIFN